MKTGDMVELFDTDGVEAVGCGCPEKDALVISLSDIDSLLKNTQPCSACKQRLHIKQPIHDAPY